MGALIVHHFGPDHTTVGGIATVIALLAEHDIGADRVRAHSTWRPQAPVSSIALAAAGAGTIRALPDSAIVHVHLSERGSFLREGALLALARKRGLTVLATLHGASFLPFAAQWPRSVHAVLRRAQLISCLDEHARAAVRRIAPHVRCEIVPNPVALDESPVTADQTQELVVFAGEIGLRKGADVLHRAWQLVAARRPGARCLMVGPAGDYLPPRSERLQVRPSVDREELMSILRQARAIALPTRAEGMPMVLTEAMSLGRPFVSTPVGAIPELAAHGGILVPVEDHHQLAKRLTELLADPHLARGIGESGRRFCAQTRSVGVLDARWRELYEAASACASPPPHGSDTRTLRASVSP
jgi:glycosyltransferase involved in cell wall biosynthesis